MTVLHRDIMATGDAERSFTEARRLGVLFVRYGQDDPPRVSTQEGGARPIVRFTDDLLGIPVEVAADLVVLDTGLALFPIPARQARSRR